MAPATSSGSGPSPEAAYEPKMQHGGVTGPDRISSSSSPRSSKQSHHERTADRARGAGQVHRTPSARSPLKSSFASSPALRRQSFSMSSIPPQLVAPPVPTKTSKHRGAASSGEQSDGNELVALDNVPPLPDHTPSRAEPDSEHNRSIRAPPVVRDDSGFIRNEETSHDPKESVEKGNNVVPRRNATLDEGNGSKPGVLGYHDAYQAQHLQTRLVSPKGSHTLYTVHSPDMVRPSVSRQERPHNPSHSRNDFHPRSLPSHNADEESRENLPDVSQTESPLASPITSGHPPSPAHPPFVSSSPPNGDHNGFSSNYLAMPASATGLGTHAISQPVRSGNYPSPQSYGRPRVEVQPSPHPSPGTTNRQHKLPKAESAPRKSRWSFSIHCSCGNT